MARWIAIAAVCAALATGNAAQGADKIVLQLSGPAQFEFAGYYAALWQGFYRAAGLDVAIKPDNAMPDVTLDETPVDSLREVAAGNAQFGVGPAVALVIRAAQGQPLLLLAPIFQRSGAEIYYRTDADYASPGALAGAKVGRLPASNVLDIEMATALEAEGVDPDKINSVPLQPDAGVAALADGSVDAVPGTAWNFPWLTHQKGFAVKSINPADYRVEFYGDTLFTSQRLAADQPKLVRGFRAASLKGWDYALQHPDEIAARLLHSLPHPPGIADAAGFTRYQAALARALARYPAVALGHSNPDRWDRIETSLTGAGALLRTADPTDFVYDSEAAARRRNDLQAFAKLAVALLVALAVGSWLGWRWWRRPRAAVEPSAAAAAGAAEASAATSPGKPEPAAAEVKAKPALAPAEPQMRLLPPDLNWLIGQLEHAIRQRVPRGSEFRLSLLPLLWRCRADPSEVRRLVLDLATAAAADLKESGGELIVGTRNYAFDEASLAATPGAQLGEYVRLTIRDNGAGLSEDAFNRIFDPAATARPAVVAAAAVLRAMGGFVRVESAEGVGTAVHLYFPRAVERDTGVKPGNPAEAAD